MTHAKDELFADQHDRLLAYVRLHAPASECDDIVGDILLRAVERMSQINGDPVAWLFSVARTRIADHYRSKGAGMNAQLSTADPEAHLTRAEAPSLEPLAALEHEEFRSLLRDKLAQLSEIERDVISFKFTDGLSNIQIAEILSVTPVNLGVILHRALRKLRDEMLKSAL